ncbi:MAG: hypothetical protein INR62_12325, partial [Rhodospirillales bacterium]|nr:hypothetical protein [Acetobacter sp.]
MKVYLRSLILVFAFPFLLAGCASTPTPQEAATADFGKPVTTDTAKPIVLAYIRATFKDPDAVKDLEITSVEKTKVYRGLVNGGGYAYGYAITFACNGKNSYGAYIGRQSLQIFSHDGRVYSQRANSGEVWS